MKCVALDIETSGLGYASEIISIGAAANFGGPDPYRTQSWLINGQDLFTPAIPIPVVVDELATLLAEAELIVLHNAAFDLAFLFGKGLVRPHQVKGKVFDTLLSARMTGPRESVSLANLCMGIGINDPRWQSMKKMRADLHRVSVQTVLEYNELDARYTLQLGETLWREAVAIYGADFALRESDYCRIMAEVRVRGKALDPERVTQATQRLLRERRRILKFILFPRQIEGSNDRTGLIKFLKAQGFDRFRLTEKGNESVAKNELDIILAQLERLADKRFSAAMMVCRAVRRLRHVEKIVGTYLDPLLHEHADADDRVHPAYTVGGTVTYRLSSSHPNGQNMPRELAHILWQPYLSADYSQAELRLAAAYAQEPALADAFAEGLDVHLDTATRMFGPERAQAMRPTAKSVNFLALYGGGAKTLAERFGVDIDDATKFVALHRKVYPRLHKFTRVAQETWQSRGYVRLISGKRIYATKEDLQRGYKAFNNIIQGGVGELVKEAMMQLDALGIPMIGQIHDAIEFPLDADQTAITSVMNNILPEDVATRTTPPIRMRVDFETKGTSHA